MGIPLFFTRHMDIMEYTHMFMELTQQLLTLATHTLTPTHTLTATTHMSLASPPNMLLLSVKPREILNFTTTPTDTLTTLATLVTTTSTTAILTPTTTTMENKKNLRQRSIDI